MKVLKSQKPKKVTKYDHIRNLIRYALTPCKPGRTQPDPGSESQNDKQLEAQSRHNTARDVPEAGTGSEAVGRRNC